MRVMVAVTADVASHSTYECAPLVQFHIYAIFADAFLEHQAGDFSLILRRAKSRLCKDG